jgi:phosphoserine phosphatase RsbU/P
LTITLPVWHSHRVPANIGSARATVELRVRTMDGRGWTLPMQGERIAMGRSTAAELSFPDDAGLSRQHLCFEREGDVWWLRDLGSKNGTLINGSRLTTPHRLQPGDRIAAGRILIEFSRSRSSATEVVRFVESAQPSVPAAVTTTLDKALGEAKSTESESVTRQMAALLRAGRELSGKQPLDELFVTILKLAIEAVGAARGVLLTLDGDELTSRAALGGDDFRISSAIRQRLLREKSSVLIQDALREAELAARVSIIDYGVRSVMAAPLQTNDRVIGIIYVDSPGLVREFSRDDLNLLTVMANIAAIRIEHARLAEVEQAEQLMGRDLERAAEIQRRLLPAGPPAITGLDMAGYHAACRTVGGDYYDFLPRPDGTVTILVADVAGKGMPAALLMSNLQARVQVLSEEPVGLAEMVTRLNRLTCRHCPGDRFITFFACTVDPRTGETSYCNAGHNPPLLLRADGSCERLEGGGPILGVFGAARYEQRSCTLAHGDTLVLYSDGVTEAPRGGSEDEFEEERLVTSAREGAGEPAEALVSRIIGALAEWAAGAPAADDVTLVIVRRVTQQATPGIITERDR